MIPSSPLAAVASLVGSISPFPFTRRGSARHPYSHRGSPRRRCRSQPTGRPPDAGPSSPVGAALPCGRRRLALPDSSFQVASTPTLAAADLAAARNASTARSSRCQGGPQCGILGRVISLCYPSAKSEDNMKLRPVSRLRAPYSDELPAKAQDPRARKNLTPRPRGDRWSRARLGTTSSIPTQQSSFPGASAVNAGHAHPSLLCHEQAKVHPHGVQGLYTRLASLA